MSEQAGRYQRSFTGMIGAMLVLLLVIGAFVAFRDVNRTDPGNPVDAVEWKQPTQVARQEASFTVLAPDRLPTGWIATSVRYGAGADGTWHIGMLTDQQRYVGLEQSTTTVSGMVETYVDENATQGQDVEVGGRTWESWSDSRDTALVRKDGRTVTLVVGTVTESVLEQFAATLR